MMECGRQDSNLHGLFGAPRLRNVPRSSSTGSQSQRVCQFRHARYAWCLRSGGADLDSPAVSSSIARTAYYKSAKLFFLTVLGEIFIHALFTDYQQDILENL